MTLPEFSARQVVLVNLAFVLLMLAGVQVARRIPIDLMPDISFNTAIVVTTWAGASPGEVERLVTQKLEDEIEDISGIKEMLSFSSQGLSEIDIEWQESLSELEYEGALSDLRAAIDRVDDLPADAEKPIVTELSVSEAYNICMVALSDVGGVGEFAVREMGRDLREQLERLKGLRKAQLQGVRDRELRVLVDAALAHQYDLTLAEIHAVIAENNQNFAGGSFTDPSSREIRVRALGNFVSPSDLGRTVVKKDPDGNHVLLEDVAEVVPGFAKRTMLGRYNGEPTVFLGISKDADTDIIDLVARVRAFVADYAQGLPDGVEAQVTWDGAKYVSARVGIMRSNLVLGVVFVVFVLWLSVGFRNAMLAIVGVPFSFLAAIVLFPVFDITINLMSLVGFVMVSGMVVDDAIIILENIYRHVEEGKPLKRAVVEGTNEVMWPVTAAVATTVAAFIPMLTISGPSGEFMSILPKTVIVCLLGSLLEALVVLPAHYLDFGSRSRVSDSAAGSSDRARLVRWSYGMRVRIDAAIVRAREAYLRGQVRVLEHRAAFLTASVAALFFALGLSRHVPVDLFPADFTQVMVMVETPADFGVDQTDAVIRGLEASLEPIAGELTDMSSWAGFGMNADMIPENGENRGILFLQFPSTYRNVANPERVLNLVRERVEGYRAANPEAFANLRVSPPRDGPPVGKPVAIRVQSEDYSRAKLVAVELQAELAGVAGVYNIEDNLQAGPRELRVELDEHRASLHGLTFQDVGFALLAANNGSVPSTFKEPTSDEDVDIRVLLREDQRGSIADLLDVEIRTPSGYRVKIGDVAGIELARAYQSLYHYDAQRAVVVYADVDNEQATSVSVNELMKARFANVRERYPDVTLIFGGEFQMASDTFEDMGRAFFLALVAIYAILAAQFRSYGQPFIVMSVIGFSFIGVVVGLWTMNQILGGYALSMHVLYAMVGLAGIVVNDSLVLIDFVNRERRRGAPAAEAVRLASSRRFRPILLTTLTTVTGLFPMAAGLTGYSRVFGPFAAAIVFGLLTASLLTLFVVPTLYLLLEDVRGGVARRLAARRPQLAAEPGAAAGGS